MSSENTHHLLTPRSYPSRLAIVVPMYNEEAMADSLRAAVEEFAFGLRSELEVILVNDGSSDRTLDKIVAWARDDRRVKVVHLSRNFGHQLASTAGLDYVDSDAVVLIDADLQDPLEVIHEMIGRYCEGYDVVYGQRESRAGEGRIKTATAWAFYRIMRALDKRLPVDVGDFRLISRECLNGLRQMRETHRFLRGMVAWAGYPQISVRYRREERLAGETKYPMRKMVAFAWTAATSFSALPLRLSLFTGCIVGLFGLEEAVRALLARLLGWYTVPGWVSLTVITSLIGGSLLISVGILGEYVAKIYEQSKSRPLYLVSRTFNVESSRASEETARAAHSCG